MRHWDENTNGEARGTAMVEEEWAKEYRRHMGDVKRRGGRRWTEDCVMAELQEKTDAPRVTSMLDIGPHDTSA